MDPIPRDRGYFRLRLFGFPILFHWSFPAAGLGIGLAVASLFFTTSLSLSLQVFCWTTAAVIALVIAHEVGHALAARALSLEVIAIVIAYVGGRCFVATPPSPRADLLFSAAGLLVQIAVMAVTLALLWIAGAPTTLPLKCVVIVFTGGNILLMIINLVPSGGNDGARLMNSLRALWVSGRA